MMLRVAIKHSFPGFTLDASFESVVPSVTGIFGASGAGKSTLLGAIAGTLRVKSAVIDLGGVRLDKLAADHRGIGVVFQDGRLFPHLTVQQNLSYGMMRAPKGRIAGAEVASLLGLENLLSRMPKTLSGGERQRVAIGRALLSQPRLLLMDEPLSALDAPRRQEILPYLAKLRRRFDIPIIYVSHALDEISQLADTLVLLDKGQVIAQGGVSEVCARADLPLAARHDAAGVLLGQVAGNIAERGLTEIGCGKHLFLVPEFKAEPRTPVRIRIPARDVILALDPPRNISVSNVIPVTICGLAEDLDRSTVFVELDFGGGQILAHVTADSANRLNLRNGDQLFALVKAMAVEVIEG